MKGENKSTQHNKQLLLSSSNPGPVLLTQRKAAALAIALFVAVATCDDTKSGRALDPNKQIRERRERLSVVGTLTVAEYAEATKSGVWLIRFNFQSSRTSEALPDSAKEVHKRTSKGYAGLAHHLQDTGHGGAVKFADVDCATRRRDEEKPAGCKRRAIYEYPSFELWADGQGTSVARPETLDQVDAWRDFVIGELPALADSVPVKSPRYYEKQAEQKAKAAEKAKAKAEEKKKQEEL
ncbi:hypothetical protein Pelo_5762 [Pelomyxa schiedti]|nr:hypothetical protein Pelo_5762 [Pelomyxa schiedti]